MPGAFCQVHARNSPCVAEVNVMAALLEYHVQAHRIDEHGSLAKTKDAAISLDTALSGRQDAFNPAELFLAAIAACMIKGIERVTPMLHFQLRGVDIALHAVRQDSPPKKHLG